MVLLGLLANLLHLALECLKLLVPPLLLHLQGPDLLVGGNDVLVLCVSGENDGLELVVLKCFPLLELTDLILGYLQAVHAG